MDHLKMACMRHSMHHMSNNPCMRHTHMPHMTSMHAMHMNMHYMTNMHAMHMTLHYMADYACLTPTRVKQVTFAIFPRTTSPNEGTPA